MADRAIDVTILICTRNRHLLLGQTLDSLAELAIPQHWRCEVLVVDNGSTDRTRETVLDRAPGFARRLRYLHEARPGKSNAMNAGIAASTADVLASTDDDVRVGRDWLVAACEPLRGSSQFAYTGGPVRPMWDGPCPDWFPRTSSDLWGTIAILDYGPAAFEFEAQRKVPLGANVALRRDLVERIGGFVPALGRSTTRVLLGQELPEFFRRARAAGARGLYVPEMEVFHHIPAARLTPSYCRRWWFGKGVSRARVDRLHPLTELGLDLRSTPHVVDVPRFMFGDACRDLWKWTWAAMRRRADERVRLETRLCYFLGYLWKRQQRNDAIMSATPATIPPRSCAF
jgi:glucosyl-dolichyl phosphate glucuronosyltransferase